MSLSAFVFQNKSPGCVLGCNILHSWEGWWTWQFAKCPVALSSTSSLQTQQWQLRGGINKNTVSISITRQQSRQQPSSLCTRACEPTHPHTAHARTNTRMLSLTHSLLHTYCIHCCEGNRWKSERGEKKKGKAPHNIINAAGLGPLATGIPLTGVTCLPNKQATQMSEKWKRWLEVAWPVKRSLVSKLAYLWGLWRYFREMRRLRATPGSQECLAEFVLCYSPQASQAALVVSRGHPGSQALMASF